MRRSYLGLQSKTLESIRNAENYGLFWAKVTKFAEDHEIDGPILPRRRNVPIRYHFGQAPAEHPETPENDYRRKYFEVIDTVITCIKERFDQEDYVMFAKCEQVLLKAVRGQQYEIELGKVCDFYHDDYDKNLLSIQLKTLPNIKIHLLL